MRAVCRSPYKLLHPSKSNKTPGPEARSGHRIVVNESDIYCYGGYNPQVPHGNRTNRNMEDFPMFRELWKFNLATKRWRKLTTTGTIPKESASYACALIGNRLFVLGGTGFPFAEVKSNKLYCCNFTTLEWTTLQCTGTFPDEVYGHSMLHLGNFIYVFGGTEGFVYSNQLFSLNLLTLEWQELPLQPHPHAEKPSPRYRHEMTNDGKYLYLLGGGTSIGAEPLNPIWRYDLVTQLWDSIETQPDDVHGYPAPRKCHGCVQLRNYAYITGGLGDGNRPAYKDMWRFDMKAYKWEKLSIKLRTEVYFHATALAPNGYMYIFGGVIYKGREGNRSRSLHRVTLKIQSLADMAWEKLLERPEFCEINRQRLLEIGVPSRYTSLIDTKYLHEPMEQVASAS